MYIYINFNNRTKIINDYLSYKSIAILKTKFLYNYFQYERLKCHHIYYICKV